jgi:hypothetical protein
MTLAWVGVVKQTGYTPLEAGMWSRFLAIYAGLYVSSNFLRPIRLSLALGAAASFDRVIVSRQPASKPASRPAGQPNAAVRCRPAGAQPHRTRTQRTAAPGADRRPLRTRATSRCRWPSRSAPA